MSLTITLNNGATFKVGDLEIVIEKVHSASDLVVRANGQLFEVSEDQWTKIAEGIELRAPYPQRGQRNRIRVQIEAPNFFVTRDRR